ncbi:hypothetical protein [Aureivirga sp. CE67]|uniref:hypothetical protein n=1 Tax=Aureivirga sp. CE67 TaxID=1788983 RepID=UPI0018CB273A|nr:hypothetical protein [Aureivirga sp. CE67]
MRLYFKCSDCGNESPFPYSANDRVSLAQEHNLQKISCQHCSKVSNFDYKLDSIKAEKGKTNKIIILLLFVISIVGEYFYFKTYYRSDLEYSMQGFMFGAILILIVPVAIASILNKIEEKKIRTFNNYRTGH